MLVQFMVKNVLSFKEEAVLDMTAISAYKEHECNLIDNGTKEKFILKNEEQKKILEAEQFDPEAFDQNTEEKGKLIDRLELLDSGFEKIFERVKEELESNKEAHKDQIHRLQDAIRAITEKSVFIQTTEERNRATVEQKFKKEHEKIQLGKNSMKVAKQYYDNMRGISAGGSTAFMDDRK